MVLAKWLESVTVLVAERKPHDEHAQFLALFFSYVYICFTGLFLKTSFAFAQATCCSFCQSGCDARCNE